MTDSANATRSMVGLSGARANAIGQEDRTAFERSILGADISLADNAEERLTGGPTRT